MKYKVIIFILLLIFNAYLAHYIVFKFDLTVFTADVLANIALVFIIDYIYKHKVLN